MLVETMLEDGEKEEGVVAFNLLGHIPRCEPSTN